MNQACKRIGVLLLVVCMLVGQVLPMHAWANDNSPRFSVAEVQAEAGETVDIAIVMSNNPGVVSVQLDVNYDNSAMRLVQVTDGGLIGAAVHSNNLSLCPYRLTWANDLAMTNYTDNGTIVTLTFEVLPGCEAGYYPVSVSYTRNNFEIFDCDANEVDFNTVAGGVTVGLVPEPTTAPTEPATEPTIAPTTEPTTEPTEPETEPTVPPTEPDSDEPEIRVMDAQAASGEAVDVAIVMSNNPGIVSAQLDVGYDNTVMTLTEVTDGGLIGTAVHSDNLSLCPYRLTWANDLATENFTANGTIVTLTFQVADTCPEGTYPVTVSYTPNNFEIFDCEANEVDFATVGGSVTVSGEAVCSHTDKTEVPSKSPGCVDPGNHKYYICNTCGVVLKEDGVTETTAEAEVIPATGHNFEEGECTVCGEPAPGSLELRSLYGQPYVVSGKNALMLADNPAEGTTIYGAQWEVIEGGDYAYFGSSGYLTARPVDQVQQVTVAATDPETGAYGIMSMYIVPADAELKVTYDGEPVGDTLYIDMVDVGSTVTLAAEIAGIPFSGDVLDWTFSAKAVAEIYTETLYLHKPGTCRITAEDPYGLKVTFQLNAFYVDPAKKLTAIVDAPSIGLQENETAQMTVFGDDEIDCEDLVFTSSNEAMATVDETGVITGGSRTGTARITAAIKDDPLKRKVVATVKIIAPQTQSLALDPEEVILDKADLTTPASRTFVITPEAEGAFGPITLTSKSLKWTSSNTALAKVKANADGSATVTITAGKDGTAVITAQTNDLAKITATTSLLVYDRTPKLAAAAVTLNPMMNSGAAVGLTAGYDNAIEDVSIASYDLEVSYDADTDLLHVAANRALRNSTINTTVMVDCENGNTYYLPLKVTVKNTVPAITIKQTAKMDLFYTDSQTTLTVTAKNAVVEGLELTGTEDFYMDDDGVIHFTEALRSKFAANPKYKPNTKATLLVYLEDYTYPVEKPITIGTASTKLTLTTDPVSSIVNTNYTYGDATPYVSFSLYNKTAKQVVDLEGTDTIQVAGYNANISTASDRIGLTLHYAAKTTLTISIQKDNWMQPVTIKHTVSVTDKAPAVKLGKTTLKVNTKLPFANDITTAALTHSNLDMEYLFFEPVKPDVNTDMLLVYYDNEAGAVEAAILPGSNGEMPKPGTYSFTAVPTLENGQELKAITVKVTVVSAEPKLTLAAKGKLDAVDPNSEIVYTVNKITNYDGRLDYVYLVQGADLFEISDLQVDAKGKQYFTLRMSEGTEYATKQTYKVSFGFGVALEEFVTNPVNVKVTQSSLKVQATPAAYAYGQNKLDIGVALTSPANARMAKIQVNQAKTSRELFAALEFYGDEVVFEEEDGTKEADLSFRVYNPAMLQAGRSYKLVLDITPVGHAADAKVTQVTVNIKIAR